MDTKDGNLEASTLAVDPAIVAVVAAGREQLGHLAQGLERSEVESRVTVKSLCTVKSLSVCRLVLAGNPRVPVHN